MVYLFPTWIKELRGLYASRNWFIHSVIYITDHEKLNETESNRYILPMIWQMIERESHSLLNIKPTNLVRHLT